MNRQDAQNIVEQGITFRQLRDLMLEEYDGARSKVIPEFTRAETHLHLRACVDRKEGPVHLKSADALTAQLILMEFSE